MVRLQRDPWWENDPYSQDLGNHVVVVVVVVVLLLFYIESI